MKEQPTYFAVLTADVRYSKVLKPMEKLIYAEITALTNMNGQCWATNRYFCELYDVSKETVSRWITNLEKQGFITRKIQYKEGTKQIEKRFISLTDLGAKLMNQDISGVLTSSHPIDENVNTPHDEMIKTPIDENVKGNNTSFNNSLSIENFLPNETSLLSIKDKWGNISNKALERSVDEFKDMATNRGNPFKDLQSGYRNYVRKGYLKTLDKIKNKTHGAIRKQVNGKVLQMKNKPNLKKLARKQIEEQAHGR